MITVKEVSTKKDLKKFVKFPFKLYKNNKYWVPPIIKDEIDNFHKTKNPVFNHADARFFLAYNRGEIVGRIVAIINWVESKEQKIKIEDASGLSEDEINKMVKDAEANADADKAAKEKVEIKNNAEQLVFQTEKAMKEAGDNISEDQKKPVDEAVEVLKKAIEADDTDAMKAASEKLTEVAGAIYQAAQEAAGAQADPSQETGGEAAQSSDQGDGAVDADFEVVDDEE